MKIENKQQLQLCLFFLFLLSLSTPHLLLPLHFVVSSSPAISHTTHNSCCEKNKNYLRSEQTKFQIFLMHHRGNRERKRKRNINIHFLAS